MSPREAIYVEADCPWCQQPHTVEIAFDDMNEDTLETIREHIEENAEQYASMGDAGEPECGASLDSGGTCSRTVDSPDDTCWDHPDEDDG